MLDPAIAQDLAFDSASWKVRGATGFGPNAGGVIQSTSGTGNLNVAPGTAAAGSRVNVWQDAGANASVNSWLWPSSGKVVRKFSGTVHKGIDIDGKAGDPTIITVMVTREVWDGRKPRDLRAMWLARRRPTDNESDD